MNFSQVALHSVMFEVCGWWENYGEGKMEQVVSKRESTFRGGYCGLRGYVS